MAAIPACGAHNSRLCDDTDSMDVVDDDDDDNAVAHTDSKAESDR